MCAIALVLETLRCSPTASASPAAAPHTAQLSSAATSTPSNVTSCAHAARFGDAFEHELLEKLYRRGPDHVAKRHVPLRTTSNAALDTGLSVNVYAAVLHLRGDALFPQPVADAIGNVLCWNGEVFGGDALSDMGEHENDTKHLSDELLRVAQTDVVKSGDNQQQRILAVLQGVLGPFAFIWVHRASQRVYFGHDRFGRRSLLYHCTNAAGDTRKLLTELAEDQVEQTGNKASVMTLTRDELARLCLSSVAITTKDANDQSVDFEEVPSNGIFVLDLSDESAFQLEFHPHPALDTDSSHEDPVASNGFSIPRDVYDCGLPLITTSSPSLLDQAANGLLVALSNAVGVRVRTIPQPQPHPPAAESDLHQQPTQARVGILFSGGIDSVVLGALAHFHAPLSEPIDLLNVCFDASSGFQSPDRLAAEISFAELQILFPRRPWRFVRVNVPFDAVLEQQRVIYELMTPCDTHMDFNIGAAFWFLARAQGFVNQHNDPALASGIELKDLNAILKSGERAADDQSLEDKVQALNLFVVEDLVSIECPVATCKRKKKPGCVVGICRVCCFKVQKSVSKLLDDETHAGEKAKCVQNLSAMGFSDDGDSQLERLLSVLTQHQATHSQPCALNCRAHRAKTASEPAATNSEAQVTTASNVDDLNASQQYTSTARVLLVGIGADEQLGGYGRHRTAFVNGGAQGLRDELAMDMRRIWKRNLGRDDRCISSHGKEARFPFLDERVVQFVSSLPTECLCDFSLERGEGDKLVLRLAARQLGLRNCTGLAKRAIQFGTRIAKHSNALAFGSNRQATGGAKFQLN